MVGVSLWVKRPGRDAGHTILSPTRLCSMQMDGPNLSFESSRTEPFTNAPSTLRVLLPSNQDVPAVPYCLHNVCLAVDAAFWRWRRDVTAERDVSRLTIFETTNKQHIPKKDNKTLHGCTIAALLLRAGNGHSSCTTRSWRWRQYDPLKHRNYLPNGTV